MQRWGILWDASQNAASYSETLACAMDAGSQSCVFEEPMSGPCEMGSEAKGGL